MTGMGEAACGGFVIREPHQGIEPGQGATGLDALDGFLHWVARLFGFADDVREALAATLMAAQSGRRSVCARNSSRWPNASFRARAP